MKTRLLFPVGTVAAMLFAVGRVALAQIPNAGFEDWTGGNPDSWITSNFPPTLVNVTQSSDAHSGQSAAQGQVVDVSGFPFPPFLTSQTFPVSMRHGSLHGWYKFTPMGGDSLAVVVGMLLGTEVIGGGAIRIGAPQSSYAEFTFSIFYADSRTPDSCFIAITVGGEFASIGSSYIVDDLSLGVATSVTETPSDLPEEIQLAQNYPNPFNPSTVIPYTLSAPADVDLSVFDLLGQKIVTLVSGRQEAGLHEAVFNASHLPGGVYFYRLQSGTFSRSRKLILLK